MSDRPAAIRDYLANMDADPAIARRFSLVAALWEELRLATHQGKTTPGEYARFRELSAVLRALTKDLRLKTAKGTCSDVIVGITDSAGFLPRDPSRIVCDSWQGAAGMATPR